MLKIMFGEESIGGEYKTSWQLKRMSRKKVTGGLYLPYVEIIPNEQQSQRSFHGMSCVLCCASCG